MTEEHEHEGYELFRHAILYRDEDAWAAIYTRYRGLLISWARRSSVRAYLGECCDDITDQALARAWPALTPERIAEFSTLAWLLSYLRLCVATTAIDCAARGCRASACCRGSTPARPMPEQNVLAVFDRAELWHLISTLVTSAAERIVLIETFVYALPPRCIQERHPRLFPDVANVYNAKRNLFARLQRNHELAQLHEEFMSA